MFLNSWISGGRVLICQKNFLRLASVRKASVKYPACNKSKLSVLYNCSWNQTGSQFDCSHGIPLKTFGIKCQKFCSELHRRMFTTSVIMAKKKKKMKEIKVDAQPDDDSTDFLVEDVLEDESFEKLRKRIDIYGGFREDAASHSKHGCLVLQPWIKWGPKMRVDTTSQLLLDEAATLASTLPGIVVVDKEVVPLRSIGSKSIFGSGTLERLTSQIQRNNSISFVFISINKMKSVQIKELEEIFKVRVLDRYGVVLAIFRHRAQTKEAKLQVALAELPYIRKRLSDEQDRMMVMEREKRLRTALDRLAGTRAIIRRRRNRSNIPTIAVVGYTNAGKTSLIHALTGDTRAEGKDQLFATLDVTAHATRLPCGLKALFIDTVGFIQDIPTSLVASFRATLEDAVCSDVVVHIRDVSHPDYECQHQTVVETLASLPLPEETPVITAANKIDLGVVKPEENGDDTYLVSAVTGEGIQKLMMAIEDKLLQVTGRRRWRFALPTGSEEIQWLRRGPGITSEEIDEDNPQVTQVISVLTEQELAAFRRNFRL